METDENNLFDENCWNFCEQYLVSRTSQNLLIYVFVAIPILGGIVPYGVTLQIEKLWYFLFAYVPILIVSISGFTHQKNYTEWFETEPNYDLVIKLCGFYQFLNLILAFLLYYDSVILLRLKGSAIIGLFDGNDILTMRSIFIGSLVGLILILISSLVFLRKAIEIRFSNISQKGNQKILWALNGGSLVFWILLVTLPIFMGFLERNNDLPFISGYIFLVLGSYFLLYDSLVKIFQTYRARNWAVRKGKM